MSTIGTPEIPAAYGGLDSTAFQDGMPYSAHILREMVRSANRLASKGQHLLNLVWLIEQAADPDAFPDGLIVPAPAVWTRFHPPVSVWKKAGLTRGQVRFRARIEENVSVQFAIGTRAAPFDPLNPVDRNNIMTMVGDAGNDFDTYGSDLDDPGIPLSESDFELIDFWMRTSEEGTSAYNSSSAVGTPEAFTLHLYLSDASWASQAWPGRAYIEFYDANEDYLLSRDISSVSADEQIIMWQDPIPAYQLNEITDAILNSAGDAFRVLLRTADVGISSIAMMAMPRTV